MGSVERGFAVAVLFWLTGAVRLVTDDDVQGHLGDALVPISLLLLGLQRRRAAGWLRSLLPLAALPALALVSTLWSVDPDRTLHRAFPVLGTTAFALWLAARFEVEAQLELLAIALWIAAGLAALAIFAWPERAVMFSGEWRGLFWHKNLLGRAAALGTLVSASLALGVPAWRRRAWVGGAACAGLLVGSASRTAQIAGLTALVVTALVAAARRLPRRRARALALAVAVAGSLAALWAFPRAGLLLERMGRDRTLTERTVIWRETLKAAAERPWLGYGYGAFWGRAGPGGREIRALFNGWNPGNAHNGYLELFAGLGWLGLAVFAVPFVRCARPALIEAARGPPWRVWPIAFLTLFAVVNLAGAALLRPHDVFWPLYVSVALSSARRSGARSARVGPDR